jgi:death-on-curing protein
MGRQMEFLHSGLKGEYDRWVKLLNGQDPYCSQFTCGIHEVLRAHFLIADFFLDNDYGIGGVGPKSLDLLHSAIYRQFVSFGGIEKWPGKYEKCATLLFGIVKDHPFHDANKRTALLVTLYQLDRINRTPRISQKEFEDFFVDVADNRLSKYRRHQDLAAKVEDADVQFIADFLQRNTREIDRRSYTITFSQLNQLLQKYGYELVNPSGNFIDVVKVEWERKYLGVVGPAVRKEYRVERIGFPGWKRQVGKGALKSVRRATGLTQERGYDSAAFYQGLDPLYSLIDIYSEPLRRLADR